jgi:tRNA nucleotidyltransferase (CCA-adding enzyme)
MQILKSHPDFAFALSLYCKLTDLGYKTYFAGGCVRDAIMGKQCRDIDLATAAKPDEVIAALDKVIDVGRDFGSVKVVQGQSQIDVTTFRFDGVYRDGRRPSSVAWCSEKEDAARRDFTINSLFWDPKCDKIIDFVGGQDDINRKLIRTNGEAQVRFEEDYLRMLRAVRFHYQLDFDLDKAVIAAIYNLKDNIKSVSKERLTDEVFKILFYCGQRLDLTMLNKTKILQPLGYSWPEDCKILHFCTKTTGLKNRVYRWFEFNAFIHFCSSVQNFNINFEALRLSSDEKKMLRTLSLRFQEMLDCKNKNLAFNLGEWIEFSFEELGHYLIGFLSFHKLLPQLLVFLLIEKNIERQKPMPFLVFEDIKNRNFKSASKVLKLIYWKQLEGKVRNKNEALNYLELLEVN